MNGLIDGNAPPFIVLLFILGTMYTIILVLKDVELLAGGIVFKSLARFIAIICLFMQLLLAVAICVRIFVNRAMPGSNFDTLDLFLMTGILGSYLMVIACGALSVLLKRKYVEERISD